MCRDLFQSCCMTREQLLSRSQSTHEMGEEINLQIQRRSHFDMQQNAVSVSAGQPRDNTTWTPLLVRNITDRRNEAGSQDSIKNIILDISDWRKCEETMRHYLPVCLHLRTFIVQRQRCLHVNHEIHTRSSTHAVV